MTRIRIKRAYEPPASDDGVRVLVDRLWPRGVARETARIDHWLKDIAPSASLRKWFGHDPALWPEFRTRYRAELGQNADAVATLRSLAKAAKTMTLVFAAKDEAHNNAVVLKELLS
jgi:uncharacterized protein YeaO (DUF488 family)